MKHLSDRLQLLLAIIGTTAFTACTPAVQKPQQDGFFAPVERVEHSKLFSDTLARLSEHTTSIPENGTNDSLRVLFRQQNKRLDDLMQQLYHLTKNDTGRTFPAADTLDEILSVHNHISHGMLLETIKDQNERLNDAVEQVKLLSRNRQMHRADESRRGVGAVQPAPAQQVPVLVAGVPSVPVRPVSGKQNPGVRRQQQFFNYGTAIQHYKNQQYGKAVEIFKSLLSRKIEPQLADRYHFWMGVCYFHLNRDGQAINEFNTVLGCTRSEKREEAYFMTGQCYERMGTKQKAAAAYEKMLLLYPGGSLAQVAKKKLALLK